MTKLRDVRNLRLHGHARTVTLPDLCGLVRGGLTSGDSWLLA
jgi:hypothetical protein